MFLLLHKENVYSPLILARIVPILHTFQGIIFTNQIQMKVLTKDEVLSRTKKDFLENLFYDRNQVDDKTACGVSKYSFKFYLLIVLPS